ncbi:TPA: hypothetical protein L7P02_000016 [Klebsiella pneumoniae]|uniref:hypothetical protein n=1 Tax=Klebsiella pneumoniae TaxID=573 RepID=UPI0008FB40B2|nr:hypothetical protein [Klebsiella pneumoniae]MCD9954052.1 hypothetical protein [Klebsiella pneumoniae]OKN12787.1 hypothetical protein AM337_001716 [Klebsiella pneumoniae]TYE76948.1 hypothetical protein DJ513_08205 [Klebsiella pneumoniae]TYE79049.1 hypothetical protein DJ507_10195 [Klebsiella pneumoniae]TYE87695.1 hypothetical protein DJ514_06515 [Klebsiella pneumoniae]
MAKLPPPITHEKVQVVMTIENGKVIDTRKVRDNELIATMDTFFWMAEKEGYRIQAPRVEECRVTDSNTNS